MDNKRDALKKEVKELLDKKEYAAAWEKAQCLVKSDGYFDCDLLDDELAALYILLYVMQQQYLQEGIYVEPLPYQDGKQLIREIEKIKFTLRRLEWDISCPEESLQIITPYMVEIMGSYSLLDREKVLSKMADWYYKQGLDDWVAYLYERYQKKNRDICFIFCTNDELYAEECKAYLQSLIIPDGTKVEIIPIKNAPSMATGYNYGSRLSKAKYKVYLHQDTFILNKNFIADIIRLFEKYEDVGMIAMAGSKKLSSNGVWWFSAPQNRYCQVYQSNIITLAEQTYQPVEGAYEEIEAADGVLLATSVDIPWREDIFDGWHFYDIAQSMEMKRQGYKVIIPGMEPKWVLHEVDTEKIIDSEYEKYRMRFLQEYAGEF